MQGPSLLFCLPLSLQQQSQRQYIPVRIQNKKMQGIYSSDGGSVCVGGHTVLLGELLGRGTTGTVYRGFDNKTRQPVAVKVIELATIKDDATRSLLENEKLALQSTHHPNLVRLREIVEEGGRCFIVTELCEGETLRELLMRRGRLGEEEAMGIFAKVVAGCLAVTQECIIHRDLKPANIIVSGALEPKVIDFGFCEVIRAQKVMRTFNVGSPSYMAPEAYLRTLYSEKSDSWSLGIVLLEMLLGHTPDEGQSIKEYFERLRADPSIIPQLAAPFSQQVREIIEKALKYLPEERMSISSMKYVADLYHIRRARDRSQPTAATTAPTATTAPHSFRPARQNPPKPPTLHTPQTLHNISGETLNCPREGFISFADFSKPQGRNKMSQISLSSSSNKNSSMQYSMGHRTNENFQFLANHVPDRPFDPYLSLSSKDILERRPKGPPAFRQVTVRYL